MGGGEVAGQCWCGAGFGSAPAPDPNTRTRLGPVNGYVSIGT